MPAFATPHTGSLQGDLVAFLRRGLEVLDAMDGFGLARPLFAECFRDASLAGHVRADLFEGDYRALASILGDATERDEIPVPSEADVRMLLDAMAGFLVFRRFVLNEQVDAHVLEQFCGTLARGLRSGGELLV